MTPKPSAEYQKQIQFFYWRTDLQIPKAEKP